MTIIILLFYVGLLLLSGLVYKGETSYFVESLNDGSHFDITKFHGCEVVGRRCERRGVLSSFLHSYV